MRQLVSTPLVDFLRELRGEIDHNYAHGRVILAVDGMMGAGTGAFADELARVYGETARSSFRASMEGFHRPRAQRYPADRDAADSYYRDSFDYGTFRRVLIDPFTMAGSVGFQTAAFDVTRDAPIVSSWQTAGADAVLIVDGPFLLRPELRGAWNYSIFVDVPPGVAYARLSLQTGRDADPEAESNARYIGGWRTYLEEAGPFSAASAVVDNTDPAHPQRVFGDSC